MSQKSADLHLIDMAEAPSISTNPLASSAVADLRVVLA